MACLLICQYCKKSYCANHSSQAPCKECAQRFFGMQEKEIQKQLKKDDKVKTDKAKQSLLDMGFTEKQLNEWPFKND